MFDTTKFYFYMTDLVLDRLQDDEALVSHDTKIYGNKFYLLHPFGMKNPAVWIDFDERTLCIENSLPKLLQGHNVFGANRLEYMCFEVVWLIYNQLGLRFSSQQRREVRQHRIRLGRLDTTCSFRLASPQQVPEVGEAIWEHFRADGCNWSIYGKSDFESVYRQQRSTRVSDKFYYKYVELQKNKIPFSVVERDWIIEFARRLLRFEVTWRGKELADLELNYADQWSRQLLKQMIIKRLKRFNFHGEIKGRVEASQLDNLNASCKMYYDLWAQGANLRKHRYNRTLDRARDYLLDHHQVDIYRPSRAGSDIPLNELLTVDNIYFGAPKYLTKRGVVFGFKSYLA